MLAKPVDEALDLGVAPHPLWEVLEDADLGSRRSRWVIADIAVDGAGVRPVGFDGYDIEVMFFYEALGNGGAGAVEL